MTILSINRDLDQAENNNSIIRHLKLPLVILRTDYLALTKGHHCAAKLLAIFENWTNWFLRQGKPERWVRLTTQAIGQHLLGEHNKAVIQKAVTLLCHEGLIRREQRRKHRHDRSWFFWFDIERVQEAIDALESPSEPETDEPDLKMDAVLETAETRVVIDTPKMVNRLAITDQSNGSKMVNLLNRDLNNHLNTTNNIVVADGKNVEEEYGSKLKSLASVMSMPKALVEEPSLVEVACPDAAAGEDDEETEEEETKPSPEETKEVFVKLRSLGIGLNPTIQKVVRDYFANVEMALAHIKERVSNGEQFKNLGGAFVKAVKSGDSPLKITSTWGLHKEVNPPTPEQLAALGEAKSRGAIADYFFSTNGITKVVLRGGFHQMPWWEYLTQ